jgi:hypothetical protein
MAFSSLYERCQFQHSQQGKRVRQAPALRAAVHQAPTAPTKQQSWQHAVLEAMQEQHCKQTTNAEAFSSCVLLDSQLDAVYDGLDDIFFSKVCSCRAQPRPATLYLHSTQAVIASLSLYADLTIGRISLQGGFVIPKRERQLIDATGGSSSYGEIQAPGVDQLLKYVFAVFCAASHQCSKWVAGVMHIAPVWVHMASLIDVGRSQHPAVPTTIPCISIPTCILLTACLRLPCFLLQIPSHGQQQCVC